MPRKTELKLHPIPFKPSYLSIPPSPFTPLTPIPSTLPLYNKPGANDKTRYPPPSPSIQLPPSPISWLWQCHQCHRTYALGVTRRCLDDGHYFCAGTTSVKNWRKAANPRKRVKRHRACASEFHYEGWKVWGRWRRSGRRDSMYKRGRGKEDESVMSGVESGFSSCSSSPWSSSSSSSSDDGVERPLSTRTRTTDAPKQKDCWNTCDYPSECRWGRRYGIHTPLVPDFPMCDLTPVAPPSPPTATSSLEGILKGENVKDVHAKKNADKAEKTDFWGALLASATRRKSVPPSSPLTQPPEKEGDGSVAMAGVENGEREVDAGSRYMVETPAVSQQSLAAALAVASAPVVTLKSMMRKTSKRSKLCKTSDTQSGDMEMLQGSSSAPVIGQMDGGFESLEDVCMEFAPLERVRSRDSGYGSTADVL